MNVLFVSQCGGNGLTETRRILDQFAERRGERSWQTPITWEGLKTVHKLLRQRARKNTSVACFRSYRDRSELMWIVGDIRRFNDRGATPTNTTTRNLLRIRDENDWRHGEVIRLLAALAALFHDFGKSSAAFQAKLHGNAKVRDAYRHEWVSLRLFAAVVEEAKGDTAWLRRLADANANLDNWQDRLLRDGLDQKPPAPLKSLPPLARTVGWLIVTHHRLPFPPGRTKEPPRSKTLEMIENAFKADWCGANAEADAKAKAACWHFPHGLPLASCHWRQHTARIATAILNHREILGQNWLDTPYVAHIARLALMLADHYYSSRPTQARYGEPDCPLHANTDEKGVLKQRLDEHLIGVEANASRIVRTLPRLQWQLPRIARHHGFRRRTKKKAFLWQNRAFDLAESLRRRTADHGFFGIDMASTGCGKTLANGRILYALADPHLGARFTVAMGLRVLTLQTGEAYRERLGLGLEDLAVLVGGGAVRELHEHQQEKARGIIGSESAAALLPEQQHVHFEGSLEDGPLNRWLEQQPKALLQSPIAVCTVDHLVPATEGIRGGHQILPMLRLLTSDLVLDEVDDFDISDLPALTRLVHWAGMLGSRVLLSSATLPPALVQGLFQAYLRGREAFEASRGEPGRTLDICCAWFDEFDAKTSSHADPDSFRTAHDDFVQRRLKKLAIQPQRRRARIIPLTIRAESHNREEKRQELCQQLAGVLQERMVELHADNCSTEPHSGKRVSIGLVRMANIDPLVTVARFLAAAGMAANCRLHLCVYHSQFPLFLRSHIEARLDRLLQREDPHALFEDQEMRPWLRRFDEPEQLFVVLATPVAEVGRDHDYDWAIVEPSSLRSIIQLAGRVRRHRGGEHPEINLDLLSTNLKALEERPIAYCRPGYESEAFPLHPHDLQQLLRPEQWERIDASHRIREHQLPQPQENLADLEHAVLRNLMLDEGRQRMPVTRWWDTHAHLSGVLQTCQPFRASSTTEPYLLLPDEDGKFCFYRMEYDGAMTPTDYLRDRLVVELGPRTGWWGEPDDLLLLEELAEAMGMELEDCARKFATIDLPVRNDDRGWWYHPGMGFSRKN